MESEEFDRIWEGYVRRRFREIERQYGGTYFDETTKHETFLYDRELEEYTRNHYMPEPEGGGERIINRYKVAACLMIAILKTKPIKKVTEKYYIEKDGGPSGQWCFNEALALFVGISVIREFFCEDISNEKRKAKKSGVEPSKEVSIWEDLFLHSLPLCAEDRARWEIELFFLRLEGFSNVLALSHQLEDLVKIKILERQLSAYTVSQQ